MKSEKASVVGDISLEVAMPLVFVDCQWRMSKWETPEDGTTVMGLWQLWDSYNCCFQTWIAPVDYWSGEDEEGDDEPGQHGWFQQFGYKMSDGCLHSAEEKVDAPPTFWCHMTFEDGNRSFRIKPSRGSTADEMLERLSQKAIN